MMSNISESRKIFERALSPEKKERIQRLKQAGDISSMLKEVQPTIDIIVKLCSEIDYDDIRYRVRNGIIEVSYRHDIFTYLSTLKNDLVEMSEELDERIFGGGYSDLILEVELDGSFLNKIDIMNGLPNFMKGLGLGKKIYKKLIKDFGFISSFIGYGPGIDSSMVWNVLSDDKELYTFSNGENLICFWNGLGFNDIINTLKVFYNDIGTKFEFDDDFLNNNNISDSDLKMILETIGQ